MANLQEVYGNDFMKPEPRTPLYRDRKCTQCGDNNLFPITNDGGSISVCMTCNKTHNFLIKYCKLCGATEDKHFYKHQFEW